MKSIIKTIKYLIVFFIFIACVKTYAQTSSGIHLIKKTFIGGEGGWDYLYIEPISRHLYISHSNQVEVLNADTHEKLGIISDTKGVHGIIEIPAFGKGFTTNGKTNSVCVFDTKTFKKTGEITTGEKPDALLYDLFSGHLFIFNNDGGSTTVIDPKTNKVLKTLELGGAPEAGVSNHKGLIFVNLEDKNEIVVFESKSFTIKNRFKLLPGETPTGLAMDVENQRLFSGCRNQLMIVLNAVNGNILAKLPIGKGVDGVVFDPVSKLAISSNGEGSMTIIHEKTPDDFQVVETIHTAPGARTITLDSKTHHLFLSTAALGPIPQATKENPNPRPDILPDTFMVLEFGK